MNRENIKEAVRYKCHRVASHAIPDTVAYIISKPLWLLVVLSIINTMINIINFLK